LITDRGLYYRGHNAIELADKHTVEEVAALIWTGALTADKIFVKANTTRSARCKAMRRHLKDLTPVEAFQVLLPLAAADDPAAYDLRPNSVMQTGVRILKLLTAIAAGRSSANGNIAKTLQRAWTPNDPKAANLLNKALILCADHELNVSSFTARCVASAGSSPYAVVLAGLAALQGVKHGGHTERVEAFFREVGTPSKAHAVITNHLKRGELIPGFGHQLYPQGDPRAKALLENIAIAYPKSPTVALARAIVKNACLLIDEHPNVDLALVTLAWTLNLPRGSALGLFALGRTIGWIGHAIEQYQMDQMIRPRAKYIGKSPTGIS
jgi:citrate synthase